MNKPSTDIDKDWLIHEIIRWICDEEKSQEQTQKLVLDAMEELTDEDALDLIFEAFERVDEIHKVRNAPAAIINEHVAIYEEIYRYFKSIDLVAGMNKAMKAKEKFLGLVTDQNKLVLKNSQTVIHAATPTVEYDINKLTPAEQQEWEELMAKCFVG